MSLVHTLHLHNSNLFIYLVTVARSLTKVHNPSASEYREMIMWHAYIYELFRTMFLSLLLFTQNSKWCCICDVFLKAIMLNVSLNHLPTAFFFSSLYACACSHTLLSHLSLSLPILLLSQPLVSFALSPPSLLSLDSVWGNWGKCAKLPYLGHTNNTAQFTCN